MDAGRKYMLETRIKMNEKRMEQLWVELDKLDQENASMRWELAEED